jgi:hypothetical protein
MIKKDLLGHMMPGAICVEGRENICETSRVFQHYFRSFHWIILQVAWL